MYTRCVSHILVASRCRRDEILRNLKREPSVEDAIAYFDSMATYVDELRKLQRELRHMIRYICSIFLSTPPYPPLNGTSGISEMSSLICQEKFQDKSQDLVRIPRYLLTSGFVLFDTGTMLARLFRMPATRRLQELQLLSLYLLSHR